MRLTRDGCGTALTLLVLSIFSVLGEIPALRFERQCDVYCACAWALDMCLCVFISAAKRVREFDLCDSFDIMCLFDINGLIRNAGTWLFFNVNLEQDSGEFMDENVSYRHFDSAFFSLFRQVI